MEYSENLLKNIKTESYVSNKVEKRYIKNRGYGLFAKESITKGEIVSISGGVIISKEEFLVLKEKGLDYAYHITDEYLICPLNPENPSDDWRMNHCCEPNCGVMGSIIFIAIKDISPDEELTYDYCMTEVDASYIVSLSCDKISCRKVLSGDDWKNRELQNKYKEYFSIHIKNKIKESSI